MTTQTIVKCAACNGLNAHGLPFFLYCGSGLEGNDDVRLISPRPCNACSVVDPLSQKYCVSCGANMNSSREHALFIQQKAVLSQTAARLTQERKRRQERRKQIITRAAWAAAIAGALVAGSYLFSQHQLRQNTGVLVYASPSGADVFVEDASNCLVKSGKIKPNGELLLKGMAPGRYSLTVSRLGYKPKEQTVILHPNKIASIGIPERIDLISDNGIESSKTASAKPEPSKTLAISAEPIKTTSLSKPASHSMPRINIVTKENLSTVPSEGKTKTDSVENIEHPAKSTPSIKPDSLISESSSTTSEARSETATPELSQSLMPPPAPTWRRSMQDPQFPDRRFARLQNGPFRAVGYPTVIPNRPNFDQSVPSGNFGDLNTQQFNKRMGPKMRRFMKMMQNEPMQDGDFRR